MDHDADDDDDDLTQYEAGPGSLKRPKTGDGETTDKEESMDQGNGEDDSDRHGNGNGGDLLGPALQPVFNVASGKLLTISLPVPYNDQQTLAGFGLPLKSLTSFKPAVPEAKLKDNVWVQNLLLVDVDMFSTVFWRKGLSETIATMRENAILLGHAFYVKVDNGEDVRLFMAAADLCGKLLMHPSRSYPLLAAMIKILSVDMEGRVTYTPSLEPIFFREGVVNFPHLGSIHAKKKITPVDEEHIYMANIQPFLVTRKEDTDLDKFSGCCLVRNNVESMDRLRENYRANWNLGLQACKAQNRGRPGDGDRLQLMNDFAPYVHPMSRVAKEAAGHANVLLNSLAGILDGGSPTFEDVAVETLVLLVDSLSSKSLHHVKELLVQRMPPCLKAEIYASVYDMAYTLAYEFGPSRAPYRHHRKELSETMAKLGIHVAFPELRVVDSRHNKKLIELGLSEVEVRICPVTLSCALGASAAMRKAHEQMILGLSADVDDSRLDADNEQTNFTSTTDTPRNNEQEEIEGDDSEGDEGDEDGNGGDDEAGSDSSAAVLAKKSAKKKRGPSLLYNMTSVFATESTLESLVQIPFKDVGFADDLYNKEIFGTRKVTYDGKSVVAVVLRYGVSADATQIASSTKTKVENNVTFYNLLLLNLDTYLRDSIHYSVITMGAYNSNDKGIDGIHVYKSIFLPKALNLDGFVFNASGRFFVISMVYSEVCHLNDMGLSLVLAGKLSWDAQMVNWSHIFSRYYKTALYAASIDLLTVEKAELAKQAATLITRAGIVKSLKLARQSDGRRRLLVSTIATFEPLVEAIPCITMGVAPISFAIKPELVTTQDLSQSERQVSIKNLLSAAFHTMSGMVSQFFNVLGNLVAHSEVRVTKRIDRLFEWCTHIANTGVGGFVIGYVEYDQSTRSAIIGSEGKQQLEIIRQVASHDLLMYQPSDGSDPVSILEKDSESWRSVHLFISLLRSIVIDVGERHFDVFEKIFPRLQWNLLCYGQALAIIGGPDAVKPHTINGTHALIAQIDAALKLGITLYGYSSELTTENQHAQMRRTGTTALANSMSPANSAKIISASLRQMLQCTWLRTVKTVSRPIEYISRHEDQRESTLAQGYRPLNDLVGEYYRTTYTRSHQESAKHHRSHEFKARQWSKILWSPGDFSEFYFEDLLYDGLEIDDGEEESQHRPQSAPLGPFPPDPVPLIKRAGEFYSRIRASQYKAIRMVILQTVLTPKAPKAPKPAVKGGKGKAKRKRAANEERVPDENDDISKDIDEGNGADQPLVTKEPRVPLLHIGQYDFTHNRGFEDGNSIFANTTNGSNPRVFNASVTMLTSVAGSAVGKRGVIKISFRVAPDVAVVDANGKVKWLQYNLLYDFASISKIDSRGMFPLNLELDRDDEDNTNGHAYNVTITRIQTQEPPFSCETFSSGDAANAKTERVTGNRELTVLGISVDWLYSNNTAFTFAVDTSKAVSTLEWRRVLELFGPDCPTPKHPLRPKFSLTRDTDSKRPPSEQVPDFLKYWTEIVHNPEVPGALVNPARFYVGQAIRAFCRNNNVLPEFRGTEQGRFDGYIRLVRENSTYAVDYDDNGKEAKVKEVDIVSDSTRPDKVARVPKAKDEKALQDEAKIKAEMKATEKLLCNPCGPRKDDTNAVLKERLELAHSVLVTSILAWTLCTDAEFEIIGSTICLSCESTIRFHRVYGLDHCNVCEQKSRKEHEEEAAAASASAPPTAKPPTSGKPKKSQLSMVRCTLCMKGRNLPVDQALQYGSQVGQIFKCDIIQGITCKTRAPPGGAAIPDHSEGVEVRRSPRSRATLLDDWDDEDEEDEEENDDDAGDGEDGDF